MFLIKIKTIYSLGLLNIIRVITHKLSLYLGFSDIRNINCDLEPGAFFLPYNGSISTNTPNNQWDGKHCFFGFEIINDSIPDWDVSCLNGKTASLSKPFHLISDFDNNIGDIKGVWEASRFDWVVSFAQKIATGDKSYQVKINAWISNWISHNKPYYGVNWMCGQESSIRVLHLSLASLLLKQTNNTPPALLSFIKVHLQRISSTIIYAIAQDNNHGTSEAAALYIGGSWLSMNGDVDGLKWQSQGLKWLENRAIKLIEDDGSFSQYSVSYHRVMLDTFSLAEVWRQKHNLPFFTEHLYKKLKVATNWLFYFTNSITGDAPNLGANDGARLIPLTGSDYRDFRPSVQLASTLFLNKVAFDFSGSFNSPLRWLELDSPVDLISTKVSKDFTNGGYVYLTNRNAEIYFNYPRFKFRPSHNDVLHIDFWVNDQNIFRDDGTFSYNAGKKYVDRYGGVESHNTIQFDSHDQMPRISRFLLGDWLKTSIKRELVVTNSEQTFTAGYKDRFGCKHIRTIKLQSNFLIIQDEVTAFKNKAVLRFRLCDINWKVCGNSITSELCTVNFSASVDIKRIELISGFESRYYYKESEIPVIEIEVHEPGIVTTEVNF